MQLNNQIAVSKNTKTLLEFLDAMYFTQDSAWPELDSSRIRIAISDYSNRNEKALYRWNNLKSDDIAAIYKAVEKLPEKTQTDVLDDSISFLQSLLKTVQRGAGAASAASLEQMLADNPGLDPNELSAVVTVKEQTEKEKQALLGDIQAKIAGLQKKKEEASKPITLFSDHKIFPYDAYKNPENENERLTTGCTITYNPTMRYPIVVEVGQGYATPVIDQKTGQVKWSGEHDYVALKKMLSVVEFQKMLRRVRTFCDAMVTCGLQNYFEMSTRNFAERRSKGIAGGNNDAENGA